MLNLRFSQDFEIRIYDSPGYTITPVRRRKRGINYIRIGQVIIALFLLGLLILAGGVKSMTDAMVIGIRHKAELFYMLIPALSVVFVVIAEDSARYVRGWI